MALKQRKNEDISWLRIGIAIWIVILWSFFMLYDAFSTTFEAPAAITGPALAAVAYIFGTEFKKAGNGG